MNKSWYVRLGRRGLWLLDSTINLMVLLLFMAAITFGIYAMWDAQQLTQEADSRQYEQYRPTSENPLSFTKLKTLNEDVFGWLEIYGTNINYPLVQGVDNETYVNTSVTGEKALSGSLFLDCRNQPSFKDFNSIIYGHHMAKQVMFGEIGEFAKQGYFEEHAYGRLYYDGAEHGIEFFAFLAVDTYDTSVYAPGVTGKEQQEAYLANLFTKAIQEREIAVQMSDQLVLLSTCTTDATNGRHILVGRICDTVYEDPFAVAQSVWTFSGHSLGVWLLRLLVVLIVVSALVLGIGTVKKRRKRKKNE